MHVRMGGRSDARLARKRLLSCGLQDKVTVICTEIARDRYMAQLTEYLKFYNAKFDTVISMLPSGDGLIQYVAKIEGFLQVDYPPPGHVPCRRERETVLYSWI